MSDGKDNFGAGDSRSRNSLICQPLLKIATPEIFRINAFRITGLRVDSTIREITKHADKLKMMEELGEGNSTNPGAFSLPSPPTVDQIREASQRLKDSEQRIIDEFFWFWPKRFGESGSDPALRALEAGDSDTAFKIWTTLETSPTDGVVAMHNIAVLWHLMALEWESHYSERTWTEEKQQETERFWRSAFKRWELLVVDDLLWDHVTQRIKQLADPRLTTGFARSMRATFPEALDKINAELAVRYAASNRMERARIHVQFMHETNQGLDNVEKTGQSVLKPATTRLNEQIQRATARAAKNPTEAVVAARELLTHASPILALFDLFFGNRSDIRNELSDEIASVCNRLQIAYHKATSDDMTCLELLKIILPFATSTDLRQILEKDIFDTFGRIQFEPIFLVCRAAFEAVETDPASGDKEASKIVASVSEILQKVPKNTVPKGLVDRVQDEIALALMHCAVVFGNKTDDWKRCIAILEDSLRFAVSPDVRERVSKNLDTVRKNDALYGGLSPISSAPSLSTINGIGFSLYGCTDLDPGTGSHLATYYFVFFGIPIFPICRYRVTPTGSGYRFFGQARLRVFDKWHLAISVGLIIGSVIALLSTANTSTSRSHKPSSSRSISQSLPSQDLPPFTAQSIHTPPPKHTAFSPSDSTYYVPKSRKAELERDSQEVEAAKARAAEFADQIESLARTIETERVYLNRNDQFEVDRFNAKVNRYNRMVAQGKALDRAANQLVDEYNAKLKLYSK